MTPEIILAFVLGIIGGFITSLLIMIGLVKKMIRVSLTKKTSDKSDED